LIPRVKNNNNNSNNNNNNGSAVSYLIGLVRRIADISGETRESSFLFQRLSVLIQRFNAVLHDCFANEVAEIIL